MGSVKGKCNSKERKKRILESFVRQKRGIFPAKKCCRKCAKSHAKKGMQMEELF
jgi:hypothetical protein